jgi:poly(3-hydroxybutyrate) depolymerase
MRITFRLGVWLLALTWALDPVVAQDRIAPGQESKLETPGYDYPSLLYVPTDWRPGTKMPLIFFLHGAGAEPTTWPWRSVTGGKGYLIAGLSYAAIPEAAAKGIPRDDQTRKAMIEFINKTRAVVDRVYGVDRNRVFLTGLSMGGWGTNHYGFHPDAEGLYRGYCIIAAGIAQGVSLDLSVAKGKPLMLLNGETDGNLPAANRGKPTFEAAGLIVTQVVLPGQGHVPSVTSMVKPLRAWLEGIEKADLRTGGVPAVAWKSVVLEGSPPRRGSRKVVLLDFLKKQPFLEKADKEKPVLVFLRSSGQDRAGKATKPARASDAVEHGSFRFPWACDAPAAAPAFTCFRTDITGLSRKESPHLNEAGTPLVALLDRGRGEIAILTRGKLKDRALGRQMRELLDEAENREADQRLADLEPALEGMRKCMEGMETARKTMAKTLKRRPGKRRDHELESVRALLASLEATFDEYVEKLGK